MMKKKYLFTLLPLLALASVAPLKETLAEEHVVNYDINDIVLNATSVSVETYSTTKLSVATKSLNSLVTWFSSDPSVCDVTREGVVTAYKEGHAQVFARYKGLSSSCEVEVYSSGIAPTIEVSIKETNFYIGDTLNVQTSLKYNYETINSALNYTCSDASVLSLSPTADGVKLRALKEGNVEVYVSATYRGVYVNEIISVNVIRDRVILDATNENLKPISGGYSLEMNKDEVANLDLVVRRNGVASTISLEEAALIYDTSIINVENNQITALKKGQTELLINYNNVSTLKVVIRVK